MKSVLDLDVTGICSSLVEVQQLLEQHGVSTAAECIERGRNLLLRASWNAQKKFLLEVVRQLWMRSSRNKVVRLLVTGSLLLCIIIFIINSCSSIVQYIINSCSSIVQYQQQATSQSVFCFVIEIYLRTTQTSVLAVRYIQYFANFRITRMVRHVHRFALF